MDDTTNTDQDKLQAIAKAVLRWRDSCKDGPHTYAGKAMAEIWKILRGDDADRWSALKSERPSRRSSSSDST